MGRRYLIAGNWKLNKTVPEALEMVRELTRLVSSVRDCDIAVAPSYTALWPVGQRLQESVVDLAAQELFYETNGAFTGTVSLLIIINLYGYLYSYFVYWGNPRRA